MAVPTLKGANVDFDGTVGMGGDTIVVAPGVVVSSEEYNNRYGALDLNQLRQRMSPELYLAFVRHIGSIESIPDVDVNELIERNIG